MLGKGIPLGFIAPSTLDEVHFTVFSGGGVGGGNAGAGGGGGAFLSSYYLSGGGQPRAAVISFDPLTNYAVTVGAGGVAGVGQSNNAGTGGTSSLNSKNINISLTGGAGGRSGGWAQGPGNSASQG